MKMLPKRILSIAVLAAWVSLSTGAHAGSVWSFTKVADTSTAVPGGSGTFTDFGAPSLNNGAVAFQGYGGPSDTLPGIFTGTAGGPVSAVADTNTTAPGDTSKFSSFEQPSIDAAGNVAYVGVLADGNQGVYARAGGTLGLIADTHTATPGFNGDFASFQLRGSASISGGTVAFSGFSRGAGGVNEGIYASAGGTLSLVADRSTALPYGSGTSQFTFIDRPMINNGNIIFNASNGSAGGAGVYLLKNGVLTRIIDDTMTLPGTSSTFGLDGAIGRGPYVFGDHTAFFATATHLSDYGFYGTDAQGNLVPLVTYHTIPPGYTSPFFSLDYLSLGTNGFVFWGGSSQIPGDLFYESYDGSIFQKIIGFGDSLDGKTVQQVIGSEYSYSGDSVAVKVQFTDGSDGIFVGTQSVPTPPGFVLLALGCAGLPVLTRRARGN
jgi:hypothetical protein